jgi:uncharacterized protein involved in outer membrane biogenesis
MKVRLQGPNLARLTPITGVPLPLTPQYDLQAQLARDGKVFVLTKMNGKMGHSDLAGRLKIDTGKERVYLEADLTSNKLDYRDIGFLIGVKPDGQIEEEKAAQKEEEETQPGMHKRVLPDAPLAAEQVRKTDARVKFRGKQVDAPNVPLSGVELNLEMINGVLHLKPIQVGVAGGTTVGDIRIDAKSEPVKTDYDIKLKGYELQEFLARVGHEKRGRGRVDGRIKLAGWGDTERASLGNSDGDIRLVMSEGELSHIALELVGIDIAESLGLLAKGDQTMPINCLVADLGVQNGVIVPRVFLLDTADTTISVEGAADFRTELMDLVIKAYPHDPSPLALRTPITLKGSFAKPKVGIHKTPLVMRGAIAAALGVAFTPFAALLAFIEPGGTKHANCERLLSLVQAPAEQQSPNKVDAPPPQEQKRVTPPPPREQRPLAPPE